MKYSIIDISSSSLSFIVADVNGDKVTPVFSDHVSLSLYHYLDGKKLSGRGIEKLIDELERVKKKCTALGVDRLWLISTAALRSINNFDKVRDAVSLATGMNICLIDVGTEARLDMLANKAYSQLDAPVLIDIGGSSIEICDLSRGVSGKTCCLGFGLLDLNRKFVDKIQPDADEADEIKKYVKKKCSGDKIASGKYATAVLTGSINRAIYDVYLDYADVKHADGEKLMSVGKFSKLAKHMLEDNKRTMLILNNAPEKLHTIGTATVVLKTLFKRFCIENIVVSDLGVKDGYLAALISGDIADEPYELASDDTKRVAAPKSAAKGRKTSGKGTGHKKLAAKPGSDKAAFAEAADENITVAAASIASASEQQVQ